MELSFCGVSFGHVGAISAAVFENHASGRPAKNICMANCVDKFYQQLLDNGMFALVRTAENFRTWTARQLNLTERSMCWALSEGAIRGARIGMSRHEALVLRQKDLDLQLSQEWNQVTPAPKQNDCVCSQMWRLLRIQKVLLWDLPLSEMGLSSLSGK